MKKQNSGFTLIELIVVIVVLGILAATAIPRFANLTDEANDAVANGVAGAIVSAAVIEFGANNGAASSFATLSSAPVLITSETIASTSITTCSGLTETFTVTLDSGGTSDAVTMPAGLCSG